MLFELTPDTSTSEETEDVIFHDVSIMEIIPIVLVSRSGIDIFEDDGRAMGTEKFDKLYLCRLIEMMQDIDHHSSVISIEIMKSFTDKISLLERDIR
jgi:hypothetical protein